VARDATPAQPGQRSFQRIAIGYALACMAVLQFARLAFLIVSAPHLQGITPGQLAGSWLLGLRFDAALTASLLGLPLLMLGLPRPGRIERWWYRAWHAVATAVIVVVSFACIVDFYFEQEVQRHIGQELLTAGHDASIIKDYAAGPAKWGLLLLALVVFACLAWWRSAIRVPQARPRWPVFVATLLVVTLAVRGSVGAKPLNPIDAFSAGRYELAQLALNGPYSMVNALSRSAPVVSAREEAAARRDLGLGDGARPFARHAGARAPHNVVVVLLESWSAEYVGAFNGGRFPGLTPEMDALAQHGLMFPRFYAAGQRSYEGIQAVLAGLPAMPGVPSLTEGLTTRISKVGSLAAAHGARTLFMQASQRRSLRLDAVATALGFGEYFGMEDLPPLRLKYPDPKAFRFGLDHESLQDLLDRLHGERRQFLAFLFTGSTHQVVLPGMVPAALVAPAGAHTGGDPFLDAIHYSDWSIGRFMDRARSEPWFGNTVFVFTADHTRGNGATVRDRFHIPALIYAPGLVAAQVDGRIGTQADLFDTVLELLGFEADYASAGHSLLDPPQTDRVLFRSGEDVGLMTSTRALMYAGSAAALQDEDARYLRAYRDLIYAAIDHDDWIAR
jgi:phosphoglycerol transferase MdoB-like AlkP superfamily enzyme